MQADGKNLQIMSERIYFKTKKIGEMVEFYLLLFRCFILFVNDKSEGCACVSGKIRSRFLISFKKIRDTHGYKNTDCRRNTKTYIP